VREICQDCDICLVFVLLLIFFYQGLIDEAAVCLDRLIFNLNLLESASQSRVIFSLSLSPSLTSAVLPLLISIPTPHASMIFRFYPTLEHSPCHHLSVPTKIHCESVLQIPPFPGMRRDMVVQ